MIRERRRRDARSESSRSLCDPAARYRLLLQINNAIIHQTTREGLFKALAVEIRKAFHYDRFSINLYDPRTNTISYFATAEGIKPEGITTESSRPLDKASVARMVIETGKPVFIADLSLHRDLPSAESMTAAGLGATLAFPLIVRQRILGTLHFSFRRLPADVTDLREFLTHLSVQTAIAVDNMLSYTALRSLNESLELQKRYLLDEVQKSYREVNFFYASALMARIMGEIHLVAASDAPVLLTGETGTGKDHIARTVHGMSPRRDHLFVKVNCAALSPTLIESELFGHARGAFTGASARRVGRFEMADRGTIFLDEIGELPPPVQAKLLQVLQEKTFERVGESTPISVNFRLIAATNQDLSARIAEKSFRQDLLFRINTITLHLPPLRDRPEDTEVLLHHFTSLHARRMRRPEPSYTPGAAAALRAYHWPGNVRELENVVQRLLILRAGDVITEADIASLLTAFDAGERGPALSMAEMERAHIERALARCGGRVGGKNGAARTLGVARTTLQYRMRKLGIIAGKE